MTLFKIKPLEWTDSEAWSNVLTGLGWLRVHCRKNGRWLFTEPEQDPGWANHVQGVPDHTTREEAKAAAEQFYIERMKAGLEVANEDDVATAYATIFGVVMPPGLKGRGIHGEPALTAPNRTNEGE